MKLVIIKYSIFNNYSKKLHELVNKAPKRLVVIDRSYNNKDKDGLLTEKKAPHKRI